MSIVDLICTTKTLYLETVPGVAANVGLTKLLPLASMLTRSPALDDAEQYAKQATQHGGGKYRGGEGRTGRCGKPSCSRPGAPSPASGPRGTGAPGREPPRPGGRGGGGSSTSSFRGRIRCFRVSSCPRLERRLLLQARGEAARARGDVCGVTYFASRMPMTSLYQP